MRRIGEKKFFSCPAMSLLRKSAAGQPITSQQDLKLTKAISTEQMQALRRDIDRIQGKKVTFGHELMKGSRKLPNYKRD